jgi:hypothetical protein
VEGEVCQKAGYMMIREKVTAREGRSPRDALYHPLACCLCCVVDILPDRLSPSP